MFSKACRCDFLALEQISYSENIISTASLLGFIINMQNRYTD